MNTSLNRTTPAKLAALARQSDETLVADARGGLTPSQMVERKLIGLLRGTSLPVSQLMTAARNRGVS
jgi:hypothetical protein